jgi:hypothetical protein
MGFPNPAIGGEAARKALDTAEEASASSRDRDATQGALDEADLQELERADYYPAATSDPEPAPVTAARNLLDRLLRRQPG